MLATHSIHRFALRFPKDLVDVKAWQPCCVGPCLRLHEQDAFVLLDFEVQEEAPEFDSDPDGCMSALVPIRQMLLRGDLRALYLGGLASVQSDGMPKNRREPPIPPGLQGLGGALDALCTFLLLEPDLNVRPGWLSASEILRCRPHWLAIQIGRANIRGSTGPSTPCPARPSEQVKQSQLLLR